MKLPHRCGWCALATLSSTWLGYAPRLAQSQDLSQGIASWAEATVGRSSSKWVGQRVPEPAASPRPPSHAFLDSEQAALRVHLSDSVSPARLALARAVLLSAERTAALLSAGGLFAPRGELGPGHAARRDLYLQDLDFTGARRDEGELVSVLDAAPAFAVVDARVPSQLRDACVAQALLEAELLELDPAESATVRSASARYFSLLLHGETCGPSVAPPLTHASLDLLHEPSELADFFYALGARQDRNRGVFLASMWHFARQRTWEGNGLRGSPDLFEAIAKALELSHDKLEEVTGALVGHSALAQSTGAPEQDPTRVRFSQLPAHLPPSVPLGLLDTSYQLIDLERERPGTRLTIWSRGEYGVRWVLSATRLSGDGSALGTVDAPVHKSPDRELQLELDGETRFVLVSLTNLGNGIPDPDLAPAPYLTRSARLIIARP